MLSGSTSLKALRKMFVKLTPGEPILKQEISFRKFFLNSILIRKLVLKSQDLYQNNATVKNVRQVLFHRIDSSTDFLPSFVLNRLSFI